MLPSSKAPAKRPAMAQPAVRPTPLPPPMITPGGGGAGIAPKPPQGATFLPGGVQPIAPNGPAQPNGAQPISPALGTPQLPGGVMGSLAKLAQARKPAAGGDGGIGQASLPSGDRPSNAAAAS